MSKAYLGSILCNTSSRGDGASFDIVSQTFFPSVLADISSASPPPKWYRVAAQSVASISPVQTRFFCLMRSLAV